MEGTAFLVRDKAHEDALCFYETGSYEVARCQIEMLESREITWCLGASSDLLELRTETSNDETPSSMFGTDSLQTPERIRIVARYRADRSRANQHSHCRFYFLTTTASSGNGDN